MKGGVDGKVEGVNVLVESVEVWHCLECMEDLMHAFYYQQGIYLLSGTGESEGVQELHQKVGRSV
jgi:hypothetical protein